MAAAPQWKVYLGKEYRAATKHVEEAACLVAFLGDGATIRCEHSLVLWHEGKEELHASESYDRVAQVVHARLQEHRDRMRAKRDAASCSMLWK